MQINLGNFAAFFFGKGGGKGGGGQINRGS